MVPPGSPFRRRALSIGAAAILQVLAFSDITAAQTAGACAAPENLARIDGALSRTARLTAAHEPLRIVAIGSSSTSGAGASTPAMNYPSRLAVELSALLPEASVTVVNRGVGGERAPDMIARFDRDVVAEKPDLVIWQVGTNSVLADEAVEGTMSSIRAGIRQLKAMGVDIVLMNAQFAPRVTAKPQHVEALARLAAIARAERVPLFDRFAVMRHWAESGQHATSELITPDNLHMTDLGYGCVAKVLAEAIVAEARDPQQRVPTDMVAGTFARPAPVPARHPADPF